MKKSQHHAPPLWADRLLQWYCSPDLLEDLQGDLHERFYTRLRSRGVVSARLNFILDTLSFVRPYVLRRKQSPYNPSYVMMLKHYFKTGLRNARRDKQYLVVNTLGLALGIGCSLILVAYIFSELSFDQSNRYADRTYRISLTTLIDTQETQFAPIPPAIGLAIKAIVPEIEKMARMMTWSGDGGPATIAYADKLFNEAGIMNADSTVFDVMDYQLVIGDRSALQRPNSIVLSETLATKIFGSDYHENNRLLNTVIKVDQKELAVTGVMQDISYTTHVKPQALVAWQGYGNDVVWDDSHAYTYVRLTTRESSETVQSKINKFIDTDENIRRVSEAFGAKVKVFIDPLTSIHMHSNKAGEFQSPGNVNYLYAFGVIAVFFLLMSSINYINLSIAASAHRFKEIGVRKVMGALRSQVQRQFVTEASVLILIASILGFLVFYLLIPPFNTIMDYQLDALLLLNGTFLIIAISMLALLALMSGYYPAFYLSLANPIAVFKNKFQVGNTKLHFRKSLLIAQFAISSLMIVAVLAVTSQMNYLSKQTLGIDKENILVISMPWPAIETLPTLKTELERVSGVTKVAATDYVPGFSTMIDEHKVERPNGEMQSSTVGRLFIDKDYMTLLGLKIIEGRNFDPTSMVDYKESFLVNEAAVRAYGWRETQQGPLGRKINGFNYGKQGKIIGVVKDVHLYSLQAKIQPLIISMGIYMQYVYVKIGANDIKQTMKDIEKVYSKVVQNYPLEYQFLDERFDRLYDADKKMNKAMVGGGVILIFISCIGLFALSAFVVNQRTKEIGIRKVLGASMREIMTMLCREYVYLILIANFIAVVGSYFLVQKWLSGYAYRVEFSWWLLFVPVVITLMLAIVSVSFQVVKAAIANPVKSLMYE